MRAGKVIPMSSAMTEIAIPLTGLSLRDRTGSGRA